MASEEPAVHLSITNIPIHSSTSSSDNNVVSLTPRRSSENHSACRNRETGLLPRIAITTAGPSLPAEDLTDLVALRDHNDHNTIHRFGYRKKGTITVENEVDANSNENARNVWKNIYKDVDMDAANVQDQDKVYSYLVSKAASIQLLRALQKRHEIKQVGNKREMALRLTVKFYRSEREAAEFSWISAAEVCESDKKFRDWSLHPSQTLGFCWKRCPDENLLLDTMPSNMKDRGLIGGPVAQVSTDAPFSLNEFARLIGVLYTVEECTLAPLQSGRCLLRKELDRRVSANAFWDNVVSKHFNDHSVKPSLNLRSIVSDVDPKAPLLTKRLEDKLRQQFAKIRAIFTVALDRWSRSGQNDPDPNLFENFVPRAANSHEISADSKRALIIFIALKCDEGDQNDNAALQFTVKLAAPGVGYDEGSCTSGSTPRSQRGQKRPLPSDDDQLTSVMTSVADSIGAYMKDGASDMACAIRAMSAANRLHESLEDRCIARRGFLLKKLTRVCKEISTVQSEAPEMLRFYERQKNAIVSDIEKIDVVDVQE